MAGRHFFPNLPLTDVGSDATRVLPVFPQLEVIKYKAGMDPKLLVQQLRGKTRAALEAPPCSRKSVDVPAALLRGGLRPLVVHAVPNRLLSVATHDYVVTQHTDIQVHLVIDYGGVDSFPTEGLVHVSTGVLVAYLTAWRAHNADVGFVLFLDEMHESDFATATLRRLQTAARGVEVYIEATATRGTGAGGAFSRPDMPGSINEYSFQRRSPASWDLTERGTPWSCIKTTGDMIIFEDDADDARVICAKFQDAGVRAYRLSAKMAVDEFRRAMSQINKPSPDDGIAAMVLDYSFRSGFTFPTVTRIIDQAQVQYLQIERGISTLNKRDAYMAEIYQARNRGARLPGLVCDYWRPDYVPEPVRVDLEGTEFDLACLAHRMLGYKPGAGLQGAVFSAGKLPRAFTRVMQGDQALRAYKVDTDWPGVERVRSEPEVLSPIVVPYDSPSRSPSLDGSSSVFTIDDGDWSGENGDTLTQQDQHELRARRSRVKARPDVDKALPIPRLHEDGSRTIGENFSRLVANLSVSGRMVYGKYYYSPVLVHEGPGIYSSFDDVVREMREMSVQVFMKARRGHVRREICMHALAAYNEATLIATAANHVMDFAAKSDMVCQNAEPGALRAWAMMVRGEYHHAESVARQAMAILLACEEFQYLEMFEMGERESRAARAFLDGLSASLRSSQDAQMYCQGMDTVRQLSGGYKLEVQPNSWRERVALKVLGDRAGIIQLAIAGEGKDPAWIDSGQESQQVFTTASQLTQAVNGYTSTLGK
jgi:hypothetical protein